MALTIQSTPEAFSSVHDDLVYTVQEASKASDPVNFPNYKYIGDVYIGGNLVARLKRVPDPVSKIGIFNIAQVVRSYMNTVFNPAWGLKEQLLGEEDFWLDVEMKFGEEYAFVAYLDVTVDSVRRYFNHYNGRIVGPTTKLNSFINKIATDQVDFYATINTERLLVSYFPSSTAPVDLDVVPSEGGGVGYFSSFTPDEAYGMQVINIAPTLFNHLAAGAITSAARFYTVVIGSQQFRVTLLCDPRYERRTLHFLNKWGGFETALFTKVSKTEYDIEKQDFGKLPYMVNPSGAVSYRSSTNVYYESRSTYAVQFKERMTLNSELLYDAEFRWLSQLLLSPMVYMEIPAEGVNGGYLVPVIIRESNYTENIATVDGLTNLTIEIEFGKTYNAQYR